MSLNREDSDEDNDRDVDSDSAISVTTTSSVSSRNSYFSLSSNSEHGSYQNQRTSRTRFSNPARRVRCRVRSRKHTPHPRTLKFLRRHVGEPSEMLSALSLTDRRPSQPIVARSYAGDPLSVEGVERDSVGGNPRDNPPLNANQQTNGQHNRAPFGDAVNTPECCGVLRIADSSRIAGVQSPPRIERTSKQLLESLRSGEMLGEVRGSIQDARIEMAVMAMSLEDVIALASEAAISGHEEKRFADAMATVESDRPFAEVCNGTTSLVAEAAARAAGEAVTTAREPSSSRSVGRRGRKRTLDDRWRRDSRPTVDHPLYPAYRQRVLRLYDLFGVKVGNVGDFNAGFAELWRQHLPALYENEYEEEHQGVMERRRDAKAKKDNGDSDEHEKEE